MSRAARFFVVLTVLAICLGLVERWAVPYKAQIMAQMSIGWPGPGPVVSAAPIALDGSNHCVTDNGATSSTTASCTLSSVTAGDLIACEWTAGNQYFVSVSDSTNGLYQVPFGNYNSTTSFAAGEAYFANSASGSISPTVTVSSSVAHLAIACQAWKNVRTTAALDSAAISQYQSVTSNTANPTTGSTQSPTGNGELNMCLTRDLAQTATAGTGFTLTDSSATSYFYPEYQIQTTGTAENCPYTASADEWIDTSAAYLPSSASAGVTPLTGEFVNLNTCTSGSVPNTTCLGSSTYGLFVGTWSVSNTSGTLEAISGSGPSDLLKNSVWLDGTSYSGSGGLNLQYETASTPSAYIEISLNGSYNPLYASFQYQTNIPQNDTSGHWEDAIRIRDSGAHDAMYVNIWANGSALGLTVECTSPSGGTTYSTSTSPPVSLPYTGAIAMPTSTTVDIVAMKSGSAGPGTYGYCTSGAGCNTVTVYQAGVSQGTIGCYSGTTSYAPSQVFFGVVGSETETAGYYVWWRNLQVGTVTPPLP